jgi:predicted PurR-regulated permease PerM
VLVTAIYMLIDGPRTYRWMTAYLSPLQRAKMDRTVEEVRPIVYSYITGQVITSTLAGLFVYGAARILDVPGALTLAVITAIFDILPIVGFIATVVITVAMAITVSPSAALWMLGAQFVYQMLENYVIVPAVYGKRMKISTFAVLVSLLVAGVLGGVVGMIVALPIVAAYPALEKIWLQRWIRPDTVEAHQEQLEEAETRPTGHSDPIQSH